MQVANIVNVKWNTGEIKYNLQLVTTNFNRAFL